MVSTLDRVLSRTLTRPEEPCTALLMKKTLMTASLWKWGVIGVGVGSLYLLLVMAAASPARLTASAPENSTMLRSPPQGMLETLTQPPELEPHVVQQVEMFCGDCHAVPNPSSYARHRWVEGVKRGYEFYARSGRDDLVPPPPQDTLAYYLTRAPVEVEFPQPPEPDRPLRTQFRVEKRFVPQEGRLPEISSMIWAPLQAGGQPFLIATDMKYGQIVALDPNNAAAAPIVLAHLKHPARIEPVELSGDGSTEFLVADLGSYMPAEEKQGRVVLLRRRPGAQVFETIVLASDFARVADVRASDFDGDGKPDLIVAEFGWQRNGGIWLLRNLGDVQTPLRFSREQLDARPGTVHLPVYDFDQDGRDDFAALVSQEYEAVDLFLNRFDRSGPHAAQQHNPFLRLQSWAGEDLTFGSSGIELTDLNQDGRMDILLTNGDTWDTLHAVPAHGVHWLENTGNLDFLHHRLASLPGAYATAVIDIDNDSDLDVIAVAWLPPNAEPEAIRGGALGSIICLEQVEPGVFAQHTLETGSPFYSHIVSGDFNHDGRVDFAVASGPMVAENRQEKFYLAIWWNQGTAD